MNTTVMLIAGVLAVVVLVSLGLVVLGYVGRTWPVVGPMLEPLYNSLEQIRQTITEGARNVLNALYNFFVRPFVEIGNAIGSWFTGLQQTLARGWATLGSYWWVPIIFVIAFPIIVIYVIWAYRRSLKAALKG